MSAIAIPMPGILDLLKSLFGQKKQVQPTPTPVATMPDPEDPANREARRRRTLEMTSRGGRRSTILTNPESRGEDYTGKKLG